MLNDKEEITSRNGNFITTLCRRPTATVTTNYKIVDGKIILHGERHIMYAGNTGEYRKAMHQNGKRKSLETFHCGLKTIFSYDEDENEFVEGFNITPCISSVLDSENNTETVFMQFLNNLHKMLEAYKSGKTDSVQLYKIPNYGLFSLWTCKFAQNEGYLISKNGENLTSTKK